MLRKGMASILSLVLLLSVMTVNVGAAAATVPIVPVLPLVGAPIVWPPLTASTQATVLANDAIVKITDSKLKAALISITKVAAGKAIRQSDLAKLAGGLDLSGKGIANAEGLQYCINLTALNLSNNKLDTLPANFKELTKLEILSLEKNKLTKFPDVLGSMASLNTLSLKNNNLNKLPPDINIVLAGVKYLDVSNNNISTVPAAISKMIVLETLYFPGNGLKLVPMDLFKVPKLVNLDLSNNLLVTLPKEVGTAPSLANLDISGNIIDALPAAIGTAPSLVKLIARRNRLIVIEPSLCTGKVKTLLLDINRLAKLPPELSSKTFDQIGVEWNFLDMSQGSDDRKIMETVTAAAGNQYLHQLAIVKLAGTAATSTTISLSWDSIANGAEGDMSWKVSKYYVYNSATTIWKKYAELDSMATQYVITGLTPNKEQKLMVGVEYDLILPYFTGSTRYFTTATIKTLDKAATAPDVSSSSEPTVSATPAPLATVTPEATTGGVAMANPSSSAGGGSSGGLIAALIVVSVLALLAIGTVVFMVLRSRKKGSYKY